MLAGVSSVHVPQPVEVMMAASVGRTATRNTPLFAEPEAMTSPSRARMLCARIHSQFSVRPSLTYTPGTMSTSTRHQPGLNAVHGLGRGVGVGVGVAVAVGVGVGVWVGGMGVGV